MDKEMEGETLTYAANLIDEAKDKVTPTVW